jgi:hypothetical protein
LKTVAAAKDVEAVLAEVVRVEADRARDEARPLDEETVEARERVIDGRDAPSDVWRISVASTPAEISALLGDAETSSPATLRQAWNFAEPVLRQLAVTDAREHRRPTGTGAFSILMTWSTRVKLAGRSTPDRGAIADGTEREKVAWRQQVLAVCRALVGLDVEVERA